MDTRACSVTPVQQTHPSVTDWAWASEGHTAFAQHGQGRAGEPRYRGPWGGKWMPPGMPRVKPPR